MDTRAYGQSRSAATAAAILEHFYHNGISIFSNYDYYPNQVVYHKTFDALEQYRRYHDNRYYYAADTDVIKKHIAQLQFPETLIADYKPEDSHSVVDFKEEIEKHLSKKNMLHHTQEEIINALKENKQPVYASFKASKLFYLYFGWNLDGIRTETLITSLVRILRQQNLTTFRTGHVFQMDMPERIMWSSVICRKI